MPIHTPALAPPRIGPHERRAVEDRDAQSHAPAANSILIVAYHFPPDSRVGGVRPAKFAKYLSLYGWRPFVLTIHTRYIPAKEPQRTEEVKAVPTVRTAVWPTVLELLLRLRNKIGRLAHPIRSSALSQGSLPGTQVSSRGESEHDRLSLLRKFGSLLFEFPDSQIGWVIPAVWNGYWLMRREHIRMLLVTSPPRSSVFIGLILSRLTGARLITDLRDPWYPRSKGPREILLSRTDRIWAWFERLLMERSHEIITTTDLYTECLRQSYRSVPPDRFHTITNGYDPEDFAALEDARPNDTFTLSYFGTLYRTRTPRPLLAALSELFTTRALPRELVQVNFIGHVEIATGVNMPDLIREYGLEGCVAIRDVIPYRQSLAEMRKADVLLLLAPEDQFQYYAIPAKTFEYIAAGKPILCLGSHGATANLIGRARCGLVVDSHDVAQIKAAILELFDDWRSGRAMARFVDITAFQRGKLTRDLITLIAKAS